MSIKLNEKVLTKKETEKVDLIWGDIPEAAYKASLFTVYPWKNYVKDTLVRIKDEEGKYVKDEYGNYVKEELKDCSFDSTDMIFVIDEGLFKGYAVRASLSTHPDMIGSLKRFFYNAELFDVSPSDLYKEKGAKVGIYVKVRTRTYTDRDGIEVTKSEPYVSYYLKYDDIVDEDIAEDMGV